MLEIPILTLSGISAEHFHGNSCCFPVENSFFCKLIKHTILVSLALPRFPLVSVHLSPQQCNHMRLQAFAGGLVTSGEPDKCYHGVARGVAVYCYFYFKLLVIFFWTCRFCCRATVSLQQNPQQLGFVMDLDFPVEWRKSATNLHGIFVYTLIFFCSVWMKFFKISSFAATLKCKLF